MRLHRLAAITTPRALERYLERNFAGSIDAFFAELNRESDRLIRTDLKKARELTRKTAGLEKLLPDNYRAHLYRFWGRHHHLSGHYAEARRLYARAIALFTRLHDHAGTARVQKALLDVLMYLTRHDEALEVGKRSLRYFKRAKSRIDYAQVLTNLGNLYHRLDENVKALTYYDRAYKIFRHLDNDYALAVVQFNRGNVTANLNRLKEAEQLYRQAAATYRSLGMELAACKADYSLAYTAFLRGSYSESLSAFTRVARKFRDLGDMRCLAMTELDRAEVNLQLNLYSQAINDALAVAEVFGRLNMAYERAKAYYFAAAGYFAFGDYAMVARYARQAQALFKKEKNRVWQIVCRFLLAKVDCREGRVSAALSTFRGISAFYRRQGDIRRYYDVRLAWLEALVSSGNSRAAAALARGLDSSRSEMAGYQRFIHDMLVGDMHNAAGNLGGAAARYRRAVREAEKLQSSIFPDEIRRFFWMDKLAAYNRLGAIYLNMGKKRRAFEWLERGKARLLQMPTEALRQISLRKIPPQLEEERLRLKAFLHRAMTPAPATTRSVAATGYIRATEHRLWRIERTLRDRGYTPKWEDVQPHRSVAEIRAGLGGHDTLLHYVCRDEVCGAFILGRDHFEFVPLPVDPTQLRGLLARFYFLANRVRTQADDQAVMADLAGNIAEQVWHPLSRKLAGYRRLFLVPDGILTRLPFYILDNGDGTALFERYETYLVPSSSGCARREADRPAGGEFARVSVMAATDGYLPGAARESTRVARHFPRARLYLGADATSTNLFDCLAAQNGLVHLVAHAAQSYENHLFSQLLLSDGPLYPFDLLLQRVRASLVVLSGCQTGDPGLYYNTDSLSLAQSFLTAGAKMVLASYWPVCDEVTCRFMDIFYQHLSGKTTHIYGALRETMIAAKKLSGDIRHWASFYLTCR